MDPPMSEWFRSVPYMLDAAAYATKVRIHPLFMTVTQIGTVSAGIYGLTDQTSQS